MFVLESQSMETNEPWPSQPSQPAPHQGLKVSSFKVNTDNLLCGDKVSNIKLDASNPSL